MSAGSSAAVSTRSKLRLARSSNVSQACTPASRALSEIISQAPPEIETAATLDFRNGPIQAMAEAVTTNSSVE